MESNKQSEGWEVVVVSSPLQGHAAALIKLSQKIRSLGAKVTFLTMDLTSAEASWKKGMRVISVPSGDPEGAGDRSVLYSRLRQVMPTFLEEFLSGEDRKSGVILDSLLAWMLPIPKKMGIPTAVHWGSTVGSLAQGFKIPQFIDSKFVDHDGTPLRPKDTFELIPGMPLMAATDLVWYMPSAMDSQKWMFRHLKSLIDNISDADWIIGNWVEDLIPGAAASIAPKVLPIGIAVDGEGSGESFAAEDSSCLGWLDAQPARSVIYAAFGSTARFSRRQLEELGAGLELTGRPFLWVAWSGLTEGKEKPYGKEFVERVGDRGKIVDWAPQEAVLRHPSIACFVTHCGWSSLTESTCNGVPLVCWANQGDQLYTQRCACESWKIGIKVKDDDNYNVHDNESGVVSREQIKSKVEEVMGEHYQSLRDNAIKYGNIAKQSLQQGGTSLANLNFLLQQLNKE